MLAEFSTWAAPTGSRSHQDALLPGGGTTKLQATEKLCCQEPLLSLRRPQIALLTASDCPDFIQLPLSVSLFDLAPPGRQELSRAGQLLACLCWHMPAAHL